jgi:acetolactate synthase-1/2/3 large subunit
MTQPTQPAPLAQPAGTKKTGAQILWESLAREGVTCVFGYPGGAILPAYDAMLDYPIRHILVRHEQGATHMADGYSRATGQVGVAIATSGPGATNMVTGLATAMLDSVPIVCITGQVGSKLIGRPGPVLIDITKDAQQSSCEFVWPDAPKLRGYRPAHRPVAREIQHALDLIHSAKKPVILAGHGISISGAGDIVRKFAERTNIPVATTLLGIGAFPASHPLNLGMMGMHGEAWVNTAIQEADLLLAFGMRFDDRVTGNLKTYALNAKKIHIDIDPAEINKNVRVDVGLVGDLKETLEQLMPQIENCDKSEWNTYVNGLKGDAAVRDIQNLPDNGHLYAAHVINDIWRATEGKAIVVTDVGQHQMWEAQYYKHDDDRTLITSGGLGTMGFALPAAIGAKVARPDAEVWVVVGDGGFQMTMCELATIAQENIDINICVINNGFLGMVRQWQEFFYERRYAATPMLSPDFVKLTEAFGLKAARVETRADVIPTVEAARRHPGTMLIDFRVEQEDSVFPMVPAGNDLHNMIRRPSAIVETGADA